MFDLLIIGGGPAGVACAKVLGSASGKDYMANKKIGMIAYTQTSDLNAAVLNNVYGVSLGVKGKDFLKTELEELKTFKPIEQLPENPIISLVAKGDSYQVSTKENNYEAKNVVLAIGHSPKIADIEGLTDWVIPHKNSLEGVEKCALKNTNLLVKDGLYVAGLTSGCASQAVIAAGTGGDVAVQILTKWNNNKFDHHHDK